MSSTEDIDFPTETIAGRHDFADFVDASPTGFEHVFGIMQRYFVLPFVSRTTCVSCLHGDETLAVEHADADSTVGIGVQISLADTVLTCDVGHEVSAD